MKRIGYIYRYNKDEQQGILVYGQYKNQRGAICDLPIKFKKEACVTSIETGNLVYFELSNREASEIEIASLNNFKLDNLENALKNKYIYSNQDTHIIFEYLGDIMPMNLEEENIITEEENCENGFSLKLLDELLEDDDDVMLSFIDDLYSSKDDLLPYHDIHSGNRGETPLSQNIDELYECFGKRKHKVHQYKFDCTSLDILDISLWFQSNHLNDGYYGSTIDEFKKLCDIFLLRKVNDQKGVSESRIDFIFTTHWEKLLNKFNDDDIKLIIHDYPFLQPLLSSDFCLRNLDVLTDEIGMPNINICKKYCEYKISECNSATLYSILYEKIENYRKYHNAQKGYGIYLDKISPRYLKKMSCELNKKFDLSIRKDIIENLKRILNLKNCAISIEDKKEDLVLLGRFLEAMERHPYILFELYYKDLPTEYKKILHEPIKKWINRKTVKYSYDSSLKPSDWELILHYWDGWIKESTKEIIFENVSTRFAQLDELSELWEAYDCNLITKSQFCLSYRKVTRDYNLYQNIREITDNSNPSLFGKSTPIAIQWLQLYRIINQFGFNSLKSFKYVKITSYHAISDIRDLLKWIGRGCDYKIDERLISKARRLVLRPLSNAEKWDLFYEERLITDDEYLVSYDEYCCPIKPPKLGFGL